LRRRCRGYRIAARVQVQGERAVRIEPGPNIGLARLREDDKHCLERWVAWVAGRARERGTAIEDAANVQRRLSGRTGGRPSGRARGNGPACRPADEKNCKHNDSATGHPLDPTTGKRTGAGRCAGPGGLGSCRWSYPKKLKTLVTNAARCAAVPYSSNGKARKTTL